MTTQERLIEADRAYWSGKDTGLADREFDAMAVAVGHISQPPRTLKGWAQYPDYSLLKPNFGLKRVSYDVAENAVRYYPKWDGVFIQIFENESGLHCITRGDGRIGKDLFPLFERLRKEFKIDFFPNFEGNFELVYPVEMGGRVELCRDLACGDLSFSCAFMKHSDDMKEGNPPKDIPSSVDGYPVDGWVCELDTKEKFKYKG